MRSLCIACALAVGCSAEIAGSTDDPAGADAGPLDTGTAASQPDAGAPDATSSPAPDAGSPGGEDGGAPEASASAGPGCKGVTNAILCEDFESGGLASDVWEKVTTNGSSASVTKQKPLEGDYALQVSLPAAVAATGAQIRTTTPFPVTGNAFYGRVWYYVTPHTPPVHSYLFAARGSLDGSLAQYRLDCNGGKLNSRYTHKSITEHGGLKKLGYVMPVEEWLCVEWQYDGKKNEMRYWMNGQAADALTVTGAEDPPWIAPPSFEDFGVGWHSFQESDVPVDVYIDGLVLAHERVGCGTVAP